MDELNVLDGDAGRHVGASLLGGTLYELAPGDTTWPYHFHHAGEELLVVVSGLIALRTPEGERTLVAGDVVAFPPGPAGAHAERNDGDGPARFLIVGTLPPLDVTEEPDTGAVNVYSAHGQARLSRSDA